MRDFAGSIPSPASVSGPRHAEELGDRRASDVGVQDPDLLAPSLQFRREEGGHRGLSDAPLATADRDDVPDLSLVHPLQDPAGASAGRDGMGGRRRRVSRFRARCGGHGRRTPRPLYNGLQSDVPRGGSFVDDRSVARARRTFPARVGRGNRSVEPGRYRGCDPLPKCSRSGVPRRCVPGEPPLVERLGREVLPKRWKAAERPGTRRRHRPGGRGPSRRRTARSRRDARGDRRFRRVFASSGRREPPWRMTSFDGPQSIAWHWSGRTASGC